MRAGVKDSVTTLAILAVLSASPALAEDFATINGKVYKDVTISRVEADGIVLRSKSAIVKLYFSELPKEVRERLHHDPAKTAAAVNPYQKPMRVAKPPALPASIEKLQRRGLLHLDCSEPDAKAWIAPAAWKWFDAVEKEKVAKLLAAHCHTQNSSIWILDKQSDQKLASYGPFQGLKSY